MSRLPEWTISSELMSTSSERADNFIDRQGDCEREENGIRQGWSRHEPKPTLSTADMPMRKRLAPFICGASSYYASGSFTTYRPVRER